MKSHSPNKRIFYDWYKLNKETLSGFSYGVIFKTFNRDHPGVYSLGAVKKIIIEINRGELTDGSFQDLPETVKPLQEFPDKQEVTPHYKPIQKRNSEVYKVLFFSDCHGWLADLKALRCINRILQKNRVDEVCINGDICDMPYLSKHTQKLYSDGILKDYTEVGEIEYTREQILKPLRLSTDALIRVRIGNHDERITKPNLLGDKQLQRLAILYKHYQTTKFEEMLGLSESEGFIYDPSDVFSYFDKFDVVHGLSLSKNAPEKNIQEYMSSGASAHSHRLHPYTKTNRKHPYVWVEMGHTRIGEQVEYFPTGKIPDWQQGMLFITFVRRNGEWFFHWECVQIIDGYAMYNGEFFSG